MEPDLIFVELGGKHRPMAFNMNVVENVQDHLGDASYEDRMTEALAQKCEDEGVEDPSELTQEQKEEVVALQGGTKMVKAQYFFSLKEGHRLAGKDFIVPDVEIEFDPEKGEQVKKENGNRPVQIEDVGVWIEDAAEEQMEKFNDFIEKKRSATDKKNS